MPDPSTTASMAPAAPGATATLSTEQDLDIEAVIAGLDALERADRSHSSTRLARVGRAVWPKLLAIGIVLAVWQLVYALNWKPSYLLPSPATVFKELWSELGTETFWKGVWLTMSQGVIAFALAALIGGVLGTAVARIPVLRSAIGSLITGMQTVPSIIWYPLAFLLFGTTFRTVLAMVILGAAPAIANGFIGGIDNVPPGLMRAGRVLGARGLALERHVVLPAALPSALQGLKQGWAFAWHALMTVEFLVLIPGNFTLGNQLANALDFVNPPALYSLIIVVITIGVLVDVLFGRLNLAVRRRYGLVDPATA
jgi:NitT/TauT family transport system permease protein